MKNFLPFLCLGALSFAQDCPQSVTCGMDEMQCYTGYYDWSQPCPPGTMCIPNKNGDCWANCPTYCPDGQKTCPGGYGPNGCQYSDTCHPIDSFCPIHCKSDEMFCSGQRDTTGKQITQDYCITAKTNYGSYECYNHCSVSCMEGQIMCSNGYDDNGCNMGDYCHTGDFCPASCKGDEMHCSGEWDYENHKQKSADSCISNTAGDCPNFCPKYCPKDAVLCNNGPTDNGCATEDFCHHGSDFCPVTCKFDETWCSGFYDNSLGKYTTAESCIPQKSGDCQNYCPKQCQKGEVLCSGGISEYDGCAYEDFCHFGEFCPVTCKSDELHCPGTWDHTQGKQTSADYCTSAMSGDCPNHCPIQCGEGQISCPGGSDDNGCSMADFCHYGTTCPVKCGSGEMMCGTTTDWMTGEVLGQESCVPEKSGDCWNNCPTFCSPSEQLCSGGIDEYSGCPMADSCYPSDQFCPVNCKSDEMHCPGPYDYTTQMKLSPDTCIPSKSGDCYNHCPAHCQADQKMCPGGSSEYDGCPMADSCVPMDQFCPVTCKSDEMLCSGAYDSTTYMQTSPDYCIPLKTGDCYNHCTPSCSANEQLCSSGTDPTTGCDYGSYCSSSCPST